VEPAAAQAPRFNGLAAGVTLEAEVGEVRGRLENNGGADSGRVSPTLTVANRGGRLQGTLIYAGTLTTRRGATAGDETNVTNSLSADYLLEAVEGVGFVEARARIAQQQLSAADGPASVELVSGGNRTEVTTVSVSPYLRGNPGGVAESELRLTATQTRGGGDDIGDSRVQSGSLYLRSPRGRAMLGWGLSGSRERVEFANAAGPTITDRANAELTLQADVDLRLFVRAGQERTDVVGALRSSYDNYGAGFEWTPSPRTTVAMQAERRYFGDAYRVLVEHRLARSALRLSSQRDVANGSESLAQGRALTWYEVYFAQFAAQIPDPVQRDQFVLALIQLQGLNRNAVAGGGVFGIGGISVQRRQDLLWTWNGPRLSMSASGYTADSKRADAGGITPTTRNDNTVQSGYAASAGWRLTPLTSTSLSGSRGMSKDTVTLLYSDLKSLSVGLATQLGPRATGALRASYSVLNGSSDPHRETGLTASLSLRF
jgi:uncharacterized protein (PEP-CTERM system associated)